MECALIVLIRKTGITLEDKGIRDEHGFEPMSHIFSSPPASSPPRNSNRSTDGSDMRMNESKSFCFVKIYGERQRLMYLVQAQFLPWTERSLRERARHHDYHLRAPQPLSTPTSALQNACRQADFRMAVLCDLDPRIPYRRKRMELHPHSCKREHSLRQIES
jgi:hypothetical protein